MLGLLLVSALAISAPTRAQAEELPAETVPLPAEHPATAVPDKDPAGVRADDSEAPLLNLETPLVASGKNAVFSLYGPEMLLRGSTAKFTLSDEFGRQLSQGEIKIADLPFKEGKPRQLEIPVEHPLTRGHTLQLILSSPDGKQLELDASFAVQQPQRSWDGWLNLVSTPPASGNWEPLRGLSIDGGVQYRIHPARREALRKGQAAFYVENVSRQMLSRYHTESGLWEKTVAAMLADKSGRGARSREPSLCSQEFAEAFARELKRHGETYAKDPPLFYSLASEPSVTRLACAADFDFSPAALAEFQRWLERDVYGTLPALNQEWGTNFTAWNEVLPMTTDEARSRLSDGVMSFAPWTDFREFQDHEFAKILREGGDYLRKYDPAAKTGITGAMGPFAFGGWDWSRLANSLDVVECYDIGGARSLWRDLAPGKPALAMIPIPQDDQPQALAEISRTLWNFALEGGPRGIVLWDSGADSNRTVSGLVDAEGKPTAPAQALAPLLKNLSGEAGAILANVAHQDDGVAILYSPASIRVRWLLEADKLHGNTWLDAWGRDSSAERRESPQLRLRESWCKLLDDAGIAWRFVSSTQLEKKDILRKDFGIKTLILPRTLCISDLESDAIKQFVQNGGRIVADACCGHFDEHGHLRKKPALDEIFNVDSASEPLIADAMNPLEILKEPQGWKPDDCKELAPIFSDKLKSAGAFVSNGDYRGSPFLAATANAVYLNLELTDYLRWRLHPDLPRAKATRDAVVRAALSDRRNEWIAWTETKLPAGTRLVWLSPRGNSAARILALMRNPQSRVNELGSEKESNWAFQKPEPFSLVLRQEMVARRLFPAATGADEKSKTKKLEGTLDPAAPFIIALSPAASAPPTLILPGKAKPGDPIEIKIAAAAQGPAEPRIFTFRVTAPDGTERPWYAATIPAPDGHASRSLITAQNDLLGPWTVTVRDLIGGSEASASFSLTPPDLKP
jgi:hypothetical protein